jgi:hypothetical protein
MAAISFPTVARPDYRQYKDGLYKPARRTEFEGNTISTRPRAGKTRRTFTVGWSKLSDADKISVFEFFADYHGYAFEFTPVGESTPVLCTFASDEIKATASGPDATGTARWSLSFDLVECSDSVILANAAPEE